MFDTVADLMQEAVKVVTPGESLINLERAFLEAQVSGFPVVSGEEGELVGIVSRSDIVRQIGVEQELAEYVSDYYRDLHHFDTKPEQSLQEIGEQVGYRIEHLKVSDFMVRNVVTVSPDASVKELAQTFVRHHIHRIPVTENKKLVGIVTTLDLVGLFANHDIDIKT